MTDNSAKRILIVACLIALAGCTGKQGATKTLIDAGITPTEIGGYSWLGCGGDDHYATEFKGKNAQGRAVTGVVCSGFWGKGGTVRFY